MALLLSLAGCQFGPKRLIATRLSYNRAYNKTENEQLLLNLVRLRYSETIKFIVVESITAQFTAQSETDFAAGGLTNISTLFGGAHESTYADQPTISYVPLQAGDLEDRVFAAIPPRSLFFLHLNGWRSDRLFPLLVQRINGISNLEDADAPPPETVASNVEFMTIVDALTRLEDEGLVEFFGKLHDQYQLHDPLELSLTKLDTLGLVKAGQQDVAVRLDPQGKVEFWHRAPVPYVAFLPQVFERPEYEVLVGLLNLEPDRLEFQIKAPLEGQFQRLNDEIPEADIAVTMRSVLGVLQLAAQCVDIPESQIEDGTVSVALDEAGQPFDCVAATGGIFRVHTSKRKPRDAALHVKHNGHYFYILDCDTTSKKTFRLLADIVDLQMKAGVSGGGPVLTLPVGR